MSNGSRLLQVYTAYETINERGDTGALLGVFTDIIKAERAVKGRGFYGGDGYVKTEWAIQTVDGVFLLQDTSVYKLDVNIREANELLREEALKKLTLEEKRALGL